MKICLTSLLAMGMFLHGTCLADLEIPKKVFRASQVAEASAKAKAEGKAVSFVLGHQQTT